MLEGGRLRVEMSRGGRDRYDDRRGGGGYYDNPPPRDPPRNLRVRYVKACLRQKP